jgi:hypothetical protein
MHKKIACKHYHVAEPVDARWEVVADYVAGAILLVVEVASIVGFLAMLIGFVFYATR